MAKSKSNSMPDFLVMFFVEDRAISRMLSDVLKTGNDPLFLETLGLLSGFVVFFSQKDGDTFVIYTLKQGVSNKYEITLNGHPCSNNVIHNGDYYAFKNKNDGKTVKTLFIATSDIQTVYKKYKLSKDTDIFIRRTSLNDISYDFNDFVSRNKHAAIRIDNSGQAFIEDLKRSVGIYANGRLTHESNRIHSFASELSQLPIKRDSRALGIVDRISFLRMCKAGNVDEQKASNGAMSTGRVVAETITETAIDTALTCDAGIAVGAAVTAALGIVAVPGIVAAAACGATVAGLNAGVKALIGKTATEWISDSILDIGKAIGNAVSCTAKSIESWFGKLSFA